MAQTKNHHHAHRKRRRFQGECQIICGWVSPQLRNIGNGRHISGRNVSGRPAGASAARRISPSKPSPRVSARSWPDTSNRSRMQHLRRRGRFGRERRRCPSPFLQCPKSRPVVTVLNKHSEAPERQSASPKLLFAVLFGASCNDFQPIIRALKLQRLLYRRGQPLLYLARLSQNYRHRLRMNCSHNVIRLGPEESAASSPEST